MDSVCWKCKQACFCELATESDTWDLISFEKFRNRVGKVMIHMTKIMIHTIMNACVYLIILSLFNIFYKWQPCFTHWLHNPISLIGFTISSLMNNISIENILLVSGHSCFMNLTWWKSLYAHFISYYFVSEKCQQLLMMCTAFIHGMFPMNLCLHSWHMEVQ